MKAEEKILSETINQLQPSANMTGEIDYDTCIKAMELNKIQAFKEIENYLKKKRRCLPNLIDPLGQYSQIYSEGTKEAYTRALYYVRRKIKNV